MLVIFMLYMCVLSPVSSDKLEGSSVLYSVVDKLFVDCFNVVCVCCLESHHRCSNFYVQ